jgi:hypothetical protein
MRVPDTTGGLTLVRRRGLPCSRAADLAEPSNQRLNRPASTTTTITAVDSPIIQPMRERLLNPNTGRFSLR